ACFFFFQAEDGIRDFHVTGVQTCALPISLMDRLVKLRSGPAVKARKAAVYRERGWREDAAAQIADAAAGADDPAERAAYVTRAGELAWERGERENALRHFEEAVRLDADRREARAGPGRALGAPGRPAGAVR